MGEGSLRGESYSILASTAPLVHPRGHDSFLSITFDSATPPTLPLNRDSLSSGEIADHVGTYSLPVFNKIHISTLDPSLHSIHSSCRINTALVISSTNLVRSSPTTILCSIMLAQQFTDRWLRERSRLFMSLFSRRHYRRSKSLYPARL